MFKFFENREIKHHVHVKAGIENETQISRNAVTLAKTTEHFLSSLENQ